MTPFDIKNLIDQKAPYEWDAQFEKDYNAFIVNKALSFNMQTVLWANEMNMVADVPKKWQFEFFYYGVPKGKRFDKWIKAEGDHPDLDAIKTYYNINSIRAVEFLSILTAEQLKIIKSKLEKGGRNAR
jgi:hypothetical protein